MPNDETPAAKRKKRRKTGRPKRGGPKTARSRANARWRKKHVKEYRAYMRELMRRRRAAAKGIAPEGETT